MHVHRFLCGIAAHTHRVAIVEAELEGAVEVVGLMRGFVHDLPLEWLFVVVVFGREQSAEQETRITQVDRPERKICTSLHTNPVTNTQAST